MKSLLHSAGLILALLLNGYASEEAARKIHETHQDGVLYVQAVVVLGERERSLEVLGTVIDEAGTLVTSYTGLALRGRDGAQNELRDIKFLGPDGTEIPAKLAFTDSDLDLAFLQPEKGDEEMAFHAVPLEEEGPKLSLFDKIVSLARQEEDLGRKSAVRQDRISAVIKRPRLVYAVTAGITGTPAFDLSGRLAGIFVRKVRGGAPGSFILLPSKDVFKAVQQLKDDADADATPEEESPEPEEEEDASPEAEEAQETSPEAEEAQEAPEEDI